MGSTIVDLGHANLTGAFVGDADFRDADLHDANLQDSSLFGTDFRGAVLAGADFGGASFFNTILGDVDLSEAVGLEGARHRGPSMLGIDTVYRSSGKIPDKFLRGVGVPDNFVVYMKSLTGRALEFYSCFISYSNVDQEFAERLHADLQASGVRCWFAPRDLRAGQKVYDQIDQAIQVHERLLLVLSNNSIRSEWVATEISRARKREIRERRKMLFPISTVPFSELSEWELFDSDIGRDSAREIREYYIPDFSRWKEHDSYQRAFKKLLSDLRANK